MACPRELELLRIKLVNWPPSEEAIRLVARDQNVNAAAVKGRALDVLPGAVATTLQGAGRGVELLAGGGGNPPPGCVPTGDTMYKMCKVNGDWVLCFCKEYRCNGNYVWLCEPVEPEL